MRILRRALRAACVVACGVYFLDLIGQGVHIEWNPYWEQKVLDAMMILVFVPMFFQAGNTQDE